MLNKSEKRLFKRLAYPTTSYQLNNVQRHAHTAMKSVFIFQGNWGDFQFTDLAVLKCLGCQFCHFFSHLRCNTSIFSLSVAGVLCFLLT